MSKQNRRKKCPRNRKTSNLGKFPEEKVGDVDPKILGVVGASLEKVPSAQLMAQPKQRDTPIIPSGQDSLPSGTCATATAAATAQTGRGKLPAPPVSRCSIRSQQKKNPHFLFPVLIFCDHRSRKSVRKCQTRFRSRFLNREAPAVRCGAKWRMARRRRSTRPREFVVKNTSPLKVVSKLYSKYFCRPCNNDVSVCSLCCCSW